MAADLFESIGDARPPRETIADGAVLLRGFVRPFEAELIPALRAIVKQAPFRHLITPGGHRMSVAMTNCGSVGWVSDPSGYRYDPIDPDTGLNWPVMPEVLRRLAAAAADEAGFTGFTPEACLINRYVPVQNCRCIRTRTSSITARRSSRSRSGCRRPSCSEVSNAATPRVAIGSNMATSRCGAGRHGYFITVWRRLPTASTACSAASGSI